MNLSKYEVFLKAVELGSLTKAGSVMGYTQSGVSHILNSIEEGFGLKLLVRDRSGVYLNSLGQELLPYIQSTCDANRRLDEKLSELQGGHTGLIRIGTIPSVSAHWMPKLLREFREKFPNITFQLRHGECLQIGNWIQHGEVDMGFISEPAQLDLFTYFLKRDRMVCILPKGHPLTALTAIPHVALKDYPYILYVDDMASEIRGILEIQNIPLTAKFTAKDDFTIMAMVEGGVGISVLPELVLQRSPFELEVRELYPPAYRNLVLAVKKDEPPAPAAQQFLKYVLTFNF